MVSMSWWWNAADDVSFYTQVMHSIEDELESKGRMHLRTSSLLRSATPAIWPVKNPLPRGEYATIPIPSSRRRGIKSFCMHNKELLSSFAATKFRATTKAMSERQGACKLARDWFVDGWWRTTGQSYNWLLYYLNSYTSAFLVQRLHSSCIAVIGWIECALQSRKLPGYPNDEVSFLQMWLADKSWRGNMFMTSY